MKRVAQLLVLALTLLILTASPARAGFEEGKAAYHAKDWANAILNLRPLAEQGHAGAQLLLANMYNDGNGVIQNHKTAFELYERAANQDHSYAQTALAAMYAEGIGADKDDKKALELFQKAAALNNQAAQFFTGMFFYQGKGTDKNLAEAYKWFKIAGANNQNLTMSGISNGVHRIIASSLSEEEKAQIETEISEWKPSGKDLADEQNPLK